MSIFPSIYPATHILIFYFLELECKINSCRCLDSTEIFKNKVRYDIAAETVCALTKITSLLGVYSFRQLTS